MDFLKDLWLFLKERKKWSLAAGAHGPGQAARRHRLRPDLQEEPHRQGHARRPHRVRGGRRGPPLERPDRRGTVVWHQGGIFVNVKGNILISGQYQPATEEQNKFVPEMYPGRPGLSRLNNLLHIYDKFGKLIKSDVVPGIKDNYGVGLDQYNNCYMMSGSTRMIGDKLYPNAWTGTILKFPFTGGRAISKGDTPVPLPAVNEPKRGYDVEGLWLENVSWLYGGVGFMGKNSSKGLAAGTGCACWNSRMTFDYLNRTFAPELERYSVAVLDSNGNLITHIGRYGNRDSMGPKSLKPVGGDEVTMVHGAYLSTMSDKFLYIADIANDRVISVKLNYASNEVLGFPEK